VEEAHPGQWSLLPLVHRTLCATGSTDPDRERLAGQRRYLRVRWAQGEGPIAAALRRLEEAAIPAKFAAAAPVGTVKVTDAKGTYQLEVRKGAENAYYAKSSAVEGVFKTSAELGEALGKKLDDFRNKKVFEFGFTEPSAVTVKQEGQVYAFTKAGADWKKDGKTVDAAQVQQLIDRLRALSTTKFAETAAGAIVAEYTVGKEQVTVAKQGDTYLARRASEPEVFVLDAAAVNELKTLAAAVKQK
jgi:hypothetical protein